MSAEDAFKTVAQATFADNEMGVKNMTPVWLTVPEVLAGFKVSEDKQKLSITIETGGKQKSFEIRPTGNLETLFRPPAAWVDAAGKTNPVLYLKDPSNLYWFEYLKDRKLVYVQHNGLCRSQSGRNLCS
jgi:hypothetical protein